MEHGTVDNPLNVAILFLEDLWTGYCVSGDSFEAEAVLEWGPTWFSECWGIRLRFNERFRLGVIHIALTSDAISRNVSGRWNSLS